MDAFYASVEQRDNPGLRGLPVAVGGSRERGVVAAASYEAGKFGVYSAMPSVTARRQCPTLVFVPPRFDVYKAVSRQIHGIFARYTSLIQPLSLDEAYLDVTAPLLDPGSATAIAEAIRTAIRAETGLTASAGVSYNKFLAKLASDHRKPDGLFVITPKMGPDRPGFASTLLSSAPRRPAARCDDLQSWRCRRPRSGTTGVAARGIVAETSASLDPRTMPTSGHKSVVA
jgi:DNA polymerase-4